MAARRRKGKWTSPGSAAARLAWWRWHHNPPKTREEYIDMVEAWPRADILKVFRAARITAHKIDTNRALAERMWERIGKFAKSRSNPGSTRKVSYFRGIGYTGANITHQGRRYVYVTTVLAKPEITRLIGTPLQRLGHVGSTKHGDLVWSYAGRLPKVRRNPVRRRKASRRK